MVMPTEEAGMLDKLTTWSLDNRLIVLVLLIAVMVAGALQYLTLPTDAFPDVSPIMVPIFAEAHGMAPEEIERLITYPIESAMNGLPGVTELKSTSAFGMAVVYVYFEDGLDIFFCRQIVAERLTGAMAELPELHEPPKLGPISTGLGEVFMYYLTLDERADTGGKDPNTYLRELNDWVVKLQLQAVPGVTDILSMGGHVLQYQVRVDPHALNRYHLTEAEIVDAVTANNSNVGGQFLVVGQEEYLVRGIGLVEQLEDLRSIQVKVENGTPIRLADVAEVDYGNEVRRGVVVLDGEQEIVAGIVLKLFGENSSQVIERLRERIPEVQASLPPGVRLVPYYDQSRLVDRAVATVRNAMLLGGTLVLLSLLLFLGNLRTAFIVAVALPLCALVAFLLMGWQGLSANLMSLGGIAIAIGMLGDGAIVMVENIFRHLAAPAADNSSVKARIVAAAAEVGRPILFSVAIIVIVFLPLFTLEGVEGKMFSPMALTISFALLGSLVAALVLTPVLSSFLLRNGEHQEPVLLSRLKTWYRSLLRVVLAHRVGVVAASLAALAGSLVLLSRVGTEFIPVLDEGQIQVNISMSPSIALDEATTLVSSMQRSVTDLHEIAGTVAKIGRPEAGSHPHPVNFGMIQAALKPEHEWRDFTTKAEIVEALDQRLSQFPGVQLNFTQPIQNLFDELLSGVRTQLAIKLYGSDLTVLRSTAEEIRETISGIPGLVDLATEQSFGQPQVQIIANRKACARYNVDVAEILEIVELDIGGEVIDELFLHTRRFGIHMRFQEQYRSDPEAIRNILVHTADGALIPLSQVAEVREVIGPIQVNREQNQRRWTITANVRGRDLGSVVADIKQRIDDSITLPSGYHLEYGGQFKNQERAMRRLAVIVPTAFALIFLMLYLSLGRLRFAALIFVNVPMALIGGVLGLLLFGEYLSVPASVGFIALFGIAVQNGLVLVTYINQRIAGGQEVREAVVEGALLRLRPVLMTALTTMLGLTPLLLSRGIGSEVQRPLAVVVVFGLLSSTFLTLVLIPALYEWFSGRTSKQPL
jgi:cobalt-zinc-cadmium resistance protein CzcA